MSTRPMLSGALLATSGPPVGYAAMGRGGVWNVYNAMPAGQRFTVVDRTGQALAARIYNIGTTQMLTHDNPATSGADGALMDDMYLSFNNPTDACIFFEGLQNGRYEVYVYAMTPNNPIDARTTAMSAKIAKIVIDTRWRETASPIKVSIVCVA